MIAARRPPCRAALIAALIATFVSTSARALVATPSTPDLVAAAAAGPVSTAALGARCIGPAFDDTAAFQAAIDTGHTVYAPALGGQCHITHALVMRTPGQIFHGDGRARTKIAIDPGFTGEGVFVAKTGEPGPVWRDFSVSFAQPDTDERAKLTRYPPAFSALNTPRFEMEHLGCYVATMCVDMKGNSGGATIADLQMSAFEVGIDIDGSLDTVRVIDPHWWPFSLSQGQQTIFMDQGSHRCIALNVGRIDDLVVRGGLFLGGLAIHVFQGKSGSAFGTIDGTDFDSTSGIAAEAGFLQIAAVAFTLGTKGAQAIVTTGGEVTIASSMVFVGAPLKAPAVELNGGSLSIMGSQLHGNGFDVSTIAQISSQSTLVLTGNIFSRTPGVPYAHPTIDLVDGRMIANGNFATDKGAGIGTFLHVTKDDAFNRIVGNSSPGWANTLPRQRQGTYLFD